ncbi:MULTISPECIES: hypothetical protein [Streptomyces]|uniref:hypothetical protein n=1 Tax=Streptomyces TaxID=1883 RepID=UPI00210B27DE|nr:MULTISPECIES: hypothetical protein [Streptomyces]UUA11597.1 hypothetical protein NNW98_38960 [Streptomyces koelreuteriae]UUA19198.1 hypothetical protein NNW99_38855 [Streptomyces sp. CRCS-T-1]
MTATLHCQTTARPPPPAVAGGGRNCSGGGALAVTWRSRVAVLTSKNTKKAQKGGKRS